MREALLEIVRLRKWWLVGVGVLLLLGVGLAIAVDGYQKPLIEARREKWSELRRQVAMAGSRDLTALYRQGNADLARLSERIPPRRQFPRVLGDILEQASSSGVSVGPITYKPHRIDQERLLAYELSLGVSGGYAAVKSFLGDLLKNRELVVVDEVNLTNADLFEENVTMDLRLTVYLREDA